MPLTKERREDLIRFLQEYKIEYKTSVPQTFTSSVKQDDLGLTIVCKTSQEVKMVLKEIDRLNKTIARVPLAVSVIGGGRGGGNDSYSIGKLWEGTDVFLQLAWEPTLKVVREEKESSDAICRISPNMMLIELNKKLYEKGYHAPMLAGCLPFMSFAGGLSTGSHTAYGYLSEMVEGIEIRLPNGKKKYIKKGDEDFELVCKSPSIGNLGVITGIDIKVQKEAKKLKRVTVLSTYENLGKQIKAGNQLEGQSVIFSSVNLNGKSPVKITRWEWVDAKSPDQGQAGPQVADRSFTGQQVVPKLAKAYPEQLADKFREVTLSPNLAGTIVAKPDSVMGPEPRLLGQITEIGLFFDYDAGKLPDFLKRIEELLHSKQLQDRFPINTAIFMRFPKGEGGQQKVAMDFASLGLNLEETNAFVLEVIAYLKTQGVKPAVHYGKSEAVAINQNNQNEQFNWEKLKEKQRKFYQKHKLDLRILENRHKALEQNKNAVARQHVDDHIVVEKYLTFADETLKHLEAEIEKQLTKYPDFNYYLEFASAEEKISKYHFLLNQQPRDFKPSKPFLNSPLKTEEERKKVVEDGVLSGALQKYQIALSMQTTLRDPVLAANQKIEFVHRKIDQTKNQLIAARDTKSISTLKWLGVVAAGLLGSVLPVIGTYFVAKYAHQKLFRPKTEKLLVERVEQEKLERGRLVPKKSNS